MKKIFMMLVLFSSILTVCMAAFTDLNASHWAYESVMRLSELGIISGMPDGTFKGNDPMTRYQSAVAMKRMLDLTHSTAQAPGQLPTDILNRISELELLVQRSLEAVEKSGEEYQRILALIEAGTTGPHLSIVSHDVDQLRGELDELTANVNSLAKETQKNQNDIALLNTGLDSSNDLQQQISFSVENNQAKIKELESSLTTQRWFCASALVLALGSFVFAGFAFFK